MSDALPREAEMTPSPTPAAPPASPAFGVAAAIVLFCGYLLAQAIGLVIGLSGVALLEALGGRLLLDNRLAFGMLASTVVEGIWVFAWGMRSAGAQLTSAAPTGFGWRRAQSRHVLLGLAGGVGTVAFSLGLMWLFPRPDDGLTTMAELALEPGFSRLVAILMAVVLAPLIEEFLFRGAMLAGFRSRLGSGVSILLVSTIFALFHLPEAGTHWTLLLSFGLFAWMVAALRDYSGSLFPSIAAHFAHNASLFVWVQLAA